MSSRRRKLPESESQQLFKDIIVRNIKRVEWGVLARFYGIQINTFCVDPNETGKGFVHNYFDSFLSNNHDTNEVGSKSLRIHLCF